MSVEGEDVYLIKELLKEKARLRKEYEEAKAKSDKLWAEYKLLSNKRISDKFDVAEGTVQYIQRSMEC